MNVEGKAVVILFVWITVMIGLVLFVVQRQEACEQSHCPPPAHPRMFREGCFCVEAPR